MPEVSNTAVVAGGRRAWGAALAGEVPAHEARKIYSAAWSACAEERAGASTHEVDMKSAVSVVALAGAANDADIVSSNAEAGA